jgi:hypothetical protein
MSQKSSVPQAISFVSQVLKWDTPLNCDVVFGSFATETRCPRYVRLSLNRRHDLAASPTTLRANKRHYLKSEADVRCSLPFCW